MFQPPAVQDTDTILNYTIALCPCLSTPGCRAAPRRSTSSKPSSGRGWGAGCLQRWGTTCLLGSRAGSATPHGEAVPRELLKEHFISKQGPGDLLCEGLDGTSRESAEQGDTTPG